MALNPATLTVKEGERGDGRDRKGQNDEDPARDGELKGASDAVAARAAAREASAEHHQHPCSEGGHEALGDRASEAGTSQRRDGRGAAIA